MAKGGLLVGETKRKSLQVYRGEVVLVQMMGGGGRGKTLVQWVQSERKSGTIASDNTPKRGKERETRVNDSIAKKTSATKLEVRALESQFLCLFRKWHVRKIPIFPPWGKRT